MRSSWIFVLLSVAATTSGAWGQVRPRVSVVQGPNGQLSPMPVDPVSSIEITNCLSVGLPFGVGSVQLRYGADNTSIDLGVEWTDVTDPVQVLTTACGFFPTCPVPSIDSCGPSVVQRLTYATLRGAVNSYVVGAGGGFSGGASFTRIIEGEISWSETLEIESPAATTLELPLTLTGTVFGAESFGNPDQTYARVRLTLTGSFAGQSVSEEVSVESISVIPEQRSIDVTPRIPVSVPAGRSLWPVSVTGQARVETKATSAGLFGTIVGAATGGADFPNSIKIGRFSGAGGAPLPPGITIRGASSGIAYESRAVCRADVDDGSGTGSPDGGVGIEDLLYYLRVFGAGGAGADLDDGSGSGQPDGGVTIEDLLFFLQRYDAGC